MQNEECKIQKKTEEAVAWVRPQITQGVSGLFGDGRNPQGRISLSKALGVNMLYETGQVSR
jgi:hypothetical protein